MTEFLVGTGGWAYFKVPDVHPLEAYSIAFDFVEVNSTFYEIASLNQVRKWRQIVPQKFEFSVRCNKKITHELKFEPTTESFQVLDKMVTICNILKAEILHFQTPQSFDFNETNSQKVKDFFKSANIGKLRIALEKRSPIPFSPQFKKTLEELNIIQCVDLLKTKPAIKSDILYTRIFGKGYHNVYQPLDEELKQIDETASQEGAKKAYFTMHSVRMFKDAGRFKIYKETGKFPNVTSSFGIDSLVEVLSEDAIFPSTRNELIDHQGWKVIDLTSTKRAHASDLLKQLPEKAYNRISDIVEALGDKDFE